jgi:hypothetical protein
MTEIRTSYKLNDFINYQKTNDLMIPELVPYLSHQNNSRTELISFNLQLENIINSITKGDNPNEIIFRNIIKVYINTLNQNNYDDYIQKIKKIDYSSKTCVHYLVSELIICCWNCSIAYKGFNLETELKNDTTPELCANVCKQISSYVATIDGNEISFHNELLFVCQRYFVKFMKDENKLDEHNPQNVDNYKGFMTLMGLLFERDVIPYKIILICLTNIKNNIFRSGKESPDGKYKICKHDTIEISNLYKGYEFLVNHIIRKKVKDENMSELIKNILEIHETIKKNNSNYKIISSTGEYNNPLRPYYMIIHNKLSNKLKEKIDINK